MSTRSFINLLGPFLLDVMIASQETNERIEKVFEKWEQSKLFPRKKKKQVRKHLRLEYSILSHAQNLLTYHEADLPIRNRRSRK